MPEEEQDDEDDGDDDFKDGVLGVGDGAADEIRAVVDGDDLHARRQAGADLLEFGLDAIDDLEGVFAAAHDDDAGDDVAVAIEVGDTAAEVRAER